MAWIYGLHIVFVNDICIHKRTLCVAKVSGRAAIVLAFATERSPRKKLRGRCTFFRERSANSDSANPQKPHAEPFHLTLC